VELNAGKKVGKPLSWRHLQMLINDREVRVVEPRKMKSEFETTGAYDISKRLQAGLDVSSFPARNDRLGLAQTVTKFSLRQTSSKPGFLDQISANHPRIIADLLYHWRTRGRARVVEAPLLNL
jgi:hypothetical protein